jgi:sugar lactone lactonase YvrE
VAAEKKVRADSRDEGHANRRVRILLGAAIALLLALLIGLIGVFVNVMTPLGIPKDVNVTEAAQGFEWVKSLYGYGPSKDEQLLNPTGVAIGPNGDIYVTDPIRSRVMVFAASGAFKRVIQTAGGGMGPGKFVRPEALAVDKQGNLFIADSWARKVIMFNNADRYVREFPAFEQARGVAVANGMLFVLDVGKVITYDVATGKPLRHFGERGHGEGQIDAYLGIESDGKTIWIADAYNRRIDAYDAKSGKFLWAYPAGASRPTMGITSKEVSATGGLQLPQDLTLDGAGRLVLIDAFNFDFAVASSKDGKVSEHLGGQAGTTDGLMYYPSSIAYDSGRDWFAVADTGNNRVQIFRLPGSGGSATAGVRRMMASPYRYLCFPALILLLTVIAALVVSRRMRRDNDGDELESDAAGSEADGDAGNVSE